MTFRIHHTVPYYSQSAHNDVPRSRDEWDAYKYCGAVKSRTVNGYFTLPSTGRINERNIGQARKVFGRLITNILKDENLVSATLVPVPSKDSFNVRDFRSLVMLREALPSYGAQISGLVRFTRSLARASAGGDRGFWAVYPHLAVEKAEARNIVLVDDIMTSGGSMLATRRRLVEAGHRVSLGIVCGRTTHEKFPKVFERHFEDVADDATSVAFLSP